MVDAFCCVNLDAGEEFYIFIISQFGIKFFSNIFFIEMNVGIATVYFTF
jgi:hypothetical protein